MATAGQGTASGPLPEGRGEGRHHRRQTPVRLHQKIEQYLRELIADLDVGERLPSEAELCERFSTTRMTVRGALQRLVAEGAVVRAAGRGTFVSHPRMHRQLPQLLSFSEEMRRRGKRATSKLIDGSMRPAFERERRLLGLTHTAEVVELRRLRFADGVPVAIQEAVLPTRFAFVLDADLEQRSLYEVLASHEVVPTWSPGTLRASLARGEDARLLTTALNAPLLVESRVTYDQHGEAIELVESRYAGERLVLDVRLDGTPPAGPGPFPPDAFHTAR